MKVTFIVDSINRYGGGGASILDLAHVIENLGNEVHFLVGRGYLRYLLRRAQMVDCGLGNHRVHRLPRAFQRDGKTYALRSRIVDLIDRMLSPERKALRILFESELVIDCWSGKIDELRIATSASISRSQAAEPETAIRTLCKISDFEVIKPQHVAEYRELCSRYDLTILQSQTQADACAEITTLSRTKFVDLAPSCVEHEVIASIASQSPYHSTRLKLVNIGSIQSRKAQHFSVEVLAKIIASGIDAELHLVGQAVKKDYLERLKAAIKEFSLESRVFIHGHRSDHLRYLAHADFLLQTSEAEGVSRVLREALLCGVPIVSFALRGTKDLLGPVLSERLLAPPKDTSEIAKIVCEIYSDLEFLRTLIDAGRLQYFKNNSMAAYYLRVNEFLHYAVKVKDDAVAIGF